MGKGVIYLARFSNGKCYVGQTRMKFEVRLYQHRWASQTDTDLAIYRAWRKHGHPVFSILDEVPVEELNIMEQLYIEQYNTLSPNGYNLNSGGGQGTIASEETKKKISASLNKPTNLKENSARMKSRMEDPSFKAKIVDNLLASCSTPEALHANRQRAFARMSDPKFKSMIVGNLTDYVRSDEGRKRNSESAKKRLSDPAVRANLSEKTKLLWADPIYREKMMLARKKGKQHDNSCKTITI